MPFTSKAQIRACFVRGSKNWNCRRWLRETPNWRNLPETSSGRRRPKSKNKGRRRKSRSLDRSGGGAGFLSCRILRSIDDRVRSGGDATIYWKEYETKTKDKQIEEDLKEMKGPFTFEQRRAVFNVYLAGLAKLADLVEDLDPTYPEIDEEEWNPLVDSTVGLISRVSPMASDILYELIRNPAFAIEPKGDEGKFEVDDLSVFQRQFDEEVLTELILLAKLSKTRSVLEHVEPIDHPTAAWIAHTDGTGFPASI